MHNEGTAILGEVCDDSKTSRFESSQTSPRITDKGMIKLCHRMVMMIIIGCMFTIQAFASSNSRLTASDQLIQNLKSFSSLTAKFSQQVTDKNGRLLQRASGTMALVRPDKFYWFSQYPRAIQQKIIADGKQIWIYDIPLKQVTVKSFRATKISAPALLLAGDTRFIRRSYLVSREGQYFSMRSRRRGSTFPKIDVWFQKQKIVKMRMLDHLGHISTIQFSKIVLNPKIDPRRFYFRVPSGVDVIR